MPTTPTEPELPPHTLRELLRRYGAGAPLGCARVAYGLLNRGYRVETTRGRYFLKQHLAIGGPARAHVASVAERAGALAQRHSAAGRLGALGLPVVPVCADAEGRTALALGDYCYALHPWIEGRHRHGTELPPGECRRLGALLGAVHRGLAVVLPPAGSATGATAGPAAGGEEPLGRRGAGGAPTGGAPAPARRGARGAELARREATLSGPRAPLGPVPGPLGVRVGGPVAQGAVDAVRPTGEIGAALVTRTPAPLAEVGGPSAVPTGLVPGTGTVFAPGSAAHILPASVCAAEPALPHSPVLPGESVAEPIGKPAPSPHPISPAEPAPLPLLAEPPSRLASAPVGRGRAPGVLGTPEPAPPADPVESRLLLVELLGRVRRRRLPDSFDELAAHRLRERDVLLARYAECRPPDARAEASWVHGDFHPLNLLYPPDGSRRSSAGPGVPAPRDGAVEAPGAMSHRARRRGGAAPREEREETGPLAILDWDRIGLEPPADEAVRAALLFFLRPDGTLDLPRVRTYAEAYRSAAGTSPERLAAAVHRVWWERLNDFWMLRWRYELSDHRADPQFPAAAALVVWWTERYEAVRAAFCGERGRA